MSTYRLHRGYAYGYDGNRAVKMTGNAAIDQTGTLLNSTNLENITIYPSEYLTVTQAEYTKYYYAGGNRIASKIGTGGFGKMTRLCTLDQSLSYNANVLFDNAIQQTVSPANQSQDVVPVETCNGYNINTELLTEPLPTLYITQTNLSFSQNNLLQQFRQNLAGGTEAVYYFHSDHLGSASWITSGTGGAVQHLLYLPFGEHFVNEQSTGYNERFTFTGKERDAETGYYYHGARFNCSDIGWLSVDPMADKYPSLTPYNYCAWNPVKLVDPDGNKIKFAKGVTKEQKKMFNEAINYLRTHDCGGRYSQLIKSRQEYIIKINSEMKSSFNVNNKTIYWDPLAGIETDRGVIMSPATVLNHEMAHATNYDDAKKKYDAEFYSIGRIEATKNFNKYIASSEYDPNNPYDSKEEQSVITGIEQRTAKKLGEIPADGVTRYNHKGKVVRVESPTSTKKSNINNNDL